MFVQVRVLVHVTEGFGSCCKRGFGLLFRLYCGLNEAGWVMGFTLVLVRPLHLVSIGSSLQK